MASRVFAGRLRSRLFLAAAGNPHLFPVAAALHRPIPCSAALSSAFLRRLSTATRRRTPKVDIGARARQLQNRRLWSYALAFSCVAGFIVIVISNFQDQMVFYVTPTDALQKFATNPSTSRLRLGGLVLEKSIGHPNPASAEIEFVVTDLITDILVKFDGNLPDLFREGHSVVVEGFVRPFPEGERIGGSVSEKARSLDCYFKATDVLAKHDEKYMPQEVAAALEKNKKLLAAEEESKMVIEAEAERSRVVEEEEAEKNRDDGKA